LTKKTKQKRTQKRQHLSKSVTEDSLAIELNVHLKGYTENCCNWVWNM